MLDSTLFCMSDVQYTNVFYCAPVIKTSYDDAARYEEFISLCLAGWDEGINEFQDAFTIFAKDFLKDKEDIYRFITYITYCSSSCKSNIPVTLPTDFTLLVINYLNKCLIYFNFLPPYDK